MIQRVKTAAEMGLTEGTRTYYTGDMANPDGYGTISNAAGYQITVRFDDGREFRLESSSFMPGPGRRFMTAAERIAERRAGLVQCLDSINATPERRAAELAQFDTLNSGASISAAVN